MRIGVRGRVLDAPEFGRVRDRGVAAVVFDSRTGRIESVGDTSESGGIDWVALPDGVDPVVVPGLIDVHAHIPQYPVVARAEDGLLPWLARHVFPAERAFRGEAAGRLAGAFFEELAAHGTTTAMLYAAIWEDGCRAAFEAARESGLRVTLGKVMMDEGSYGDLAPTEALRVSLEETERLCLEWHGAAGGRLRYAVSPRFAVTCSAQLLAGAAAVAERHGAWIQTHLAENVGEVRAVAARFPEARDYTDVYDRAGLLGPRAVLGHAIHLGDREIEILAARDARVAHCPTANFFLGSGIMPLDRLRAAGVKVGLGSDVAAGPELDLWRVMREAVVGQTARRFSDDSVKPLTPVGAFHLATAGGAAVLGIEGEAGRIDPGLQADLVVLDLNAILPMGGRFRPPDATDGAGIIDLCVHRSGPHAIVGVFAGGRRVGGRSAG